MTEDTNGMGIEEIRSLETFEQKTANVLRSCAQWLDRNAEQLAGTFAGGGIEWSIEFYWHTMDESMNVPKVNIKVNKTDRDWINLYN